MHASLPNEAVGQTAARAPAPSPATYARSRLQSRTPLYLRTQKLFLALLGERAKGTRERGKSPGYSSH